MYTGMKISTKCKRDDLNRIIYQRIGSNESWYEYYKDTMRITKFTQTQRNLYTKKENRFDYLDDGRLKLLDQPLRKIEKRYDKKGRLTYYKDSTGFECEWKYERKKVITNVLSGAKER